MSSQRSGRIPPISGQEMIRFLRRELGYVFLHQRGSHVKVRKFLASGKHTVIVPNKKTLAKGTLNDILACVAIANGISKEELLSRLTS
jgi:predicted RNA binding protein YcfA (HicA-like mRNA interferase family)